MPINRAPFPVNIGVVPGSLTSDQIASVAKKYAPILRFHPDENYFLCSVEWFLAHATLYGPNAKIIHPNVSALPVGSDDDQWWLEMEDSVKPGDLSTAKVYLHINSIQGKSYTDFQFWFFYGYNGPGTLHVQSMKGYDISVAPLGEHWADWELTTIRVDNASLEPLGVYLSQHGAGAWITDLSSFQRQGTQFIIYPSKNGHANYAATGDNPSESGDYKLVKYHLCNYTQDGGRAFNCAQAIETVAIDSLPNGVRPRWLDYPYRWGKGEGLYLSQTKIEGIIAAALAPYLILTGPLAPIVAIIAAVMAKHYSQKQLDDSNGIYGPAMQVNYWNGSLIPSIQFNHNYSGINTNRGCPPAVVFFNKIYHCYYQDGDSHNGIMHATSINGESWKKQNYIGFDTSSGIAAVVYNNVIHVFYRDPNGNGTFHISSSDGTGFGNKEYIGLDIDFGPNVAVLNNSLCLVGIDAGGKGIMFATLTGNRWSHGYTGQATNRPNPPSIVSFGGKYRIYYQDGNGHNGIMNLVSTDGINWTNNAYIGYCTSAGPCAVVYQEKVHILFRDPDGNGILYIYSGDGQNFTNYGYTGLCCDDQPHAASGDVISLVCIDHGGNGIMWMTTRYW